MLIMHAVLTEASHDSERIENKGLCIDKDTISSRSHDALTLLCKHSEFMNHFCNQGELGELAEWCRWKINRCNVVSGSQFQGKNPRDRAHN